jgi:FkbM family methyltransferase
MGRSFYHDFAALRTRFGLAARGVVHVGAHIGQEAHLYDAAGLSRQVWIEPTPDVFERLLQNIPKRPDVRAFRVAGGAENGTAKMFVLANRDGGANSLLEPKTHLKDYPQYPLDGSIEVPVRRIDDLLTENGLSLADFNWLTLDTQGFELQVLRGCEKLIEQLEVINTEVFTGEVYAHCAKLPEMDAFLGQRGFVRAICELGKRGFGDALYVRREKLSPWQQRRINWFGPPGR